MTDYEKLMQAAQNKKNLASSPFATISYSGKAAADILRQYEVNYKNRISAINEQREAQRKAEEMWKDLTTPVYTSVVDLKPNAPLNFKPMWVEGSPAVKAPNATVVTQEAYDAVMQERQRQQEVYKVDNKLRTEMNTAKTEWENATDTSAVMDFMNFLYDFDYQRPKDVALKKYQNAAEKYYQNRYNTDADLTTIFNSLQIEGREGEAKEISKILYGDSAVDDYVGANTMAGVVGVSSGITSTLDATGGNLLKLFGWENNPISLWNQSVQSTYNYWAQKGANAAVAIGDTNNIGGTLIQGFIGVIPDAILAYMTRGKSLSTSGTMRAIAGKGIKATTANIASQAVKLEGKLSPIVSIASKSKMVADAAATTLKTAAKNPMYWTSFTRTFGTDYEAAKEKGADEGTAYLYAMVTSTMNALVESGGGIQVLPARLQNKTKSQILDWIKSALEEGGEEVVQSIISEMNEKLMYDYDKEIFSLTNEDAVINPKRLATEFAMGSAIGGIAGGGQVVASNVSTAKYTKLGKSVRNSVNIADLLSYGGQSSDESIRNIARENTEEKISNKDLGILYAYAVRDVDAAFNSVSDVEGVNKVLGELVAEGNSQTLNNIIFSRYINRLDTIDPQTVSGYNNGTNVNQDNGGNVNVETFDNRGFSEVDSQRSEANTGTEGEGRRIRTENERDFVRRVTGTSQKSGRKIRPIGKSLFAYTPKEADGSQASLAVEILNKAGIKAVYCEGNTESNADGVTTFHTEAVTTPDGTIYVSDSSSLSSIQIAAHEAVHYHQKNDTAEYAEFQSVLCDNVLWGTDAYIAVAKDIFESYHRAKYERIKKHVLTDEEVNDIINSPEYAAPFLIEFTAYVNEAISANSTESIKMFSKVFSNWDAVVEASRRFNEAIGLDFSATPSDTTTPKENSSEAENLSTDSQATHIDSESAPTGGRVLDMPAITVEQQNFVKKIGKALGRNVEFVNMDKFLKEHDVDTERLKIYPDGAIDSEGNIYIWYNTKKAVQFLFKHELTHFGERSKYYTSFVNVVRESRTYLQWLQEKTGLKNASLEKMEAVLMDKHRAAQSGLKKMGYDEARAEIIADFVGDKCFGESLEDINKIVNSVNDVKERNAAVRFLYDFFLWLKNKLVGIGAIKNEVSVIEENFARMIDDANNTKTSDTNDGGLKYSIVPNMSEADRTKILRAKQVNLVNVENSDLNNEFDFADLENNIKSKVEKTLLKKFQELGLLKKYKSVAISDVEFHFTGKGVRKSLNSQETSYGGSKADFTKVVIHLQELLDNSVLIETHTDKGKGTDRENQRLKQVYVLLSAMQEGNTVIPVQFEVKQYIDENNRLYLAVALTKIETGVVGNTASDKQMRTFLIPISNISIPELFSKINPKDGKFLKYIPDEFLNASQIEAKKQALSEDETKYGLKFSVATESNTETDTESTDFTAEFKTLMQSFQNGEISQDEYMRRVSELYQESIDENGQIKQGEIVEEKNKPFAVPKSVNDGTKVRQHVSRILESGQATPEQENVFKEMILDDKFSYTPTSNEANIRKAEKAIEKEGYQKAKENWSQNIANWAADANTVAKGEALLQLAFEQKNTVDIINLAAQLAELGTYIGQGLQAMSLVKRMGGLGQLVYLERCVARINNSLEKKIHDGKANPVKIDPTLAQQLAESKTEAEFEITYAAIVKDIAAQVPPTFANKWNALRYVCMLFNPVTHIRNIVGNAIFFPGVRIKNLIAVGMEKGVSKDKRTKVVKVNKAYQEYAEKDFEQVADLITGTGKYNPSDEIRSNQRIFKSAWLETARKFNFDLLEKEDAIFLKRHYKHALGGYLQAQGIDLSQVTPAQLTKAREYAIQEAQKATYRDASKAANMISKFAKTNAATEIFIEGLLPYKKTPINIIKRGVEYSPIGLIKTLSKGVYDLKKGKFNTTQFIDGLASGLTGTGICILGALLASLGVVKGGFDDEEKWFRKLNGEQEYSIEIGGISYTIDWATPASIPLFLGVAIAEYDADKDADIISSIWDFGMAAFEPLLNLSLLSGLEDAIAAVSYADDGEKITSFLGTTMESYFAQFLPSVFGKTANLFDETRRTTYIDKTSNVPAVIQEAWNKVVAKLPIASQTRAEYIDAWGETQYTGNFMQRFFQQFVSPGYASTINVDDTSQELMRIYKQTGESGVFPSTPRKYFTVKGMRRDLSKEEYFDYATFKGQTQADLVDEAIHSDEYAKLTDEQKVEVIKDIYSYSGALAKCQLDYSYEEIAAMQGEDKKGNIILTEDKYNRLDEKAKQMLVDEYFMESSSNVKAYKTAKNGKSVVEYFCEKVKE